MEVSLEAFRILIFLLPGIVTLQIRSLLAIPEKTKLIDMVITALVLTFLDHVLSAILPTLGWLGALEERVTLESEFWRLFKVQGGLQLLLYSSGLGVFLGYLRFRGWDYAFLRALRITRRSGYMDVWNETFNRDRGSWLIVSLKDGRRLLGWAATYSDEPGTHELFLARAAWVDQEGKQTAIQGPGILLSKESEIVAVEFWSPKE